MVGNLQNRKVTTTFYEDGEHEKEEESKESKFSKEEEEIKKETRTYTCTCSTTTKTYLEEKTINSFLKNRCLSIPPICSISIECLFTQKKCFFAMK